MHDTTVKKNGMQGEGVQNFFPLIVFLTSSAGHESP